MCARISPCGGGRRGGEGGGESRQKGPASRPDLDRPSIHKPSSSSSAMGRGNETKWRFICQSGGGCGDRGTEATDVGDRRRGGASSLPPLPSPPSVRLQAVGTGFLSSKLAASSPCVRPSSLLPRLSRGQILCHYSPSVRPSVPRSKSSAWLVSSPPPPKSALAQQRRMPRERGGGESGGGRESPYPKLPAFRRFALALLAETKGAFGGRFFWAEKRSGQQ